MARAKTIPGTASRPGYEPGKGFPDPNAKPKSTTGGRDTHYPSGSGDGAVCGKKPSAAALYDSVNPTCEWCAHYLAKAKGVTAARHPEAYRRQEAADQAAAAAETHDEG